jgi:hypothetical protein
VQETYFTVGITSDVFSKQKVPERILTQNLVGDGEVLVISMPEKKGVFLQETVIIIIFLRVIYILL